MVKRAKSPDLPEDAKYLVVHQPYPLNANFELPGDHIAFALWAASVLGAAEPVLGLHHKPARATVLLEIEKGTELSGMLGEHRWAEVLRDPREGEKERASRVYYSVYRTTRDANKDGWKRIHVEPDWFTRNGWTATTGPFKYPYPETHYCAPLIEDPTGKSIARPLPVRVKPPPPSAPALVPGSAQWVDAAQAGRLTTQRQGQRPQGKKGRGRGGGASGSGPSGLSRAAGGASSGASVPATRGGPAAKPNPLAAGTANPWMRLSASGGGEIGGVSSASPSSDRHVSMINSVPSNRSGSYPMGPPGLTHPSRSSGPAVEMAPPNLTRSRQPASTNWADMVEEELALDSPSDVPSAPAAHTPIVNQAGGSYVPYDDDDDDSDEGSYTVVPYASSVFSDATTVRPEPEIMEDKPVDLWALSETQEDDDEESAKKKEKKEKEPMCSVHGILCKKGICAEYAKLKRARLRAEEAEERAKKIEEAKQRKKEKNSAKRKSSGKGKNRVTEGVETWKKNGGASKHRDRMVQDP